jgi:hypothetical protein
LAFPEYILFDMAIEVNQTNAQGRSLKPATCCSHDVEALTRFVTETGKILPVRITASRPSTSGTSRTRSSGLVRCC